MYHVPTDATWDPTAMVESLRRQKVYAEAVGNTVRVTLPATNPGSMVSKLFRWLFPYQPLEITISYCPGSFIRNIELTYDLIRMPLDFPSFDAITEAMEERGYLTDDDRSIVARYCPGSPELTELVGELERLRAQKEDFCAKRDFESALLRRKQEVIVRNKIDAKLFELVGRKPIIDEP